MPHSMTGFASLTVAADTIEFTWEIRSVNHRFLDVAVRLPEEFRRLETACRERAAAHVGRGRIDCSLRMAVNRRAAAPPQLDEDAVAQLSALQSALIEAFPEAAPLSVAELLRRDGLLLDAAAAAAAGSCDAALLEGLDQAFGALVETRAAEGRRIAVLLQQRAADIEAAVGQARPLLSEAGRRYRDKLMARIERLDVAAQPERLEQELAIVAQRMDIVEELDRLISHTQEIRATLGREEPIGRRLDFLIQELNREANTMSSKSQDEELTRIAVELKVVIEQMREQAQNLE